MCVCVNNGWPNSFHRKALYDTLRRNHTSAMIKLGKLDKLTFAYSVALLACLELGTPHIHTM